MLYRCAKQDQDRRFHALFDKVARSDVLGRATGLEHVLLSFVDPFTVNAWSGRDVDHVPNLAAQIQLIHDQVLPAFN